MEGLGKKLQEARLARKLTLDEAARMTKIRPARLPGNRERKISRISPASLTRKVSFSSTASFSTSMSRRTSRRSKLREQVTVDGYSYLQDNPAPADADRAVVRRKQRAAGRCFRLSSRVVVLVLGFVR